MREVPRPTTKVLVTAFTWLVPRQNYRERGEESFVPRAKACVRERSAASARTRRSVVRLSDADERSDGLSRDRSAPFSVTGRLAERTSPSSHASGD